MSKKWRAAAIGLTGHGGFGHGLHLPYQFLPDVEMVAVSDPDEEGRAKAVQQSGASRGYADYKEMLEQEELDIVSVCPRHTIYHRDMVLAVAEAKCHIYCEKAIAPDLSEADEMLDACERNGVLIGVSHQARYVEPFLSVRKMIEDCVIGDLVSVHGRFKEDQRGGGEDMLTLGTHVFDMTRFLVGDASWVMGAVMLNGKEVTIEDRDEPTEPIGPIAGDHVRALFGFKRGITGTFESVRGQSKHGTRMSLTLIGTDGTLSLTFGGSATLTKCSSAAGYGDDADWEVVDFEPGPPIPNESDFSQDGMIPRGNILAVWDIMQKAENGGQPVSSGRDARASLEMILGVYKSHLEGRRVKFPISGKHPLELGTV
jgi:predicted dehydrogenase